MCRLSSNSPILLLEDDTFDVIVLRRSLAAANLKAELCHASNGEDALATLNQMKINNEPSAAPTTAILDINVPRISGFDVCQHIRQDPSLQHLHIIFFSGSSSANDEKRAFEAGANAYFDKNKGPDGLVEYLQHLLEAPNQAPPSRSA